MKQLHHHAGNAIGEYALVGVLIALVCIAGCLTAGANLSDIFGGLKTDLAAHGQVAAAQQTAITDATIVSPDSAFKSTVQQLTAQDRVILGETLAEKLQTTGANGTTELLSNQLEQTAKQLLDNGSITPEQSDAILRLANQGHQMAKIEQVLEQGVGLANGDMQKFADMTFTIDGKTMAAKDWAEQVGFTAEKPYDFANADILSAYPGTGGPEVAKFRDLYQEVMASGLASDPAVAATIQSAATQIATTGESVEDGTWAAINMSSQYGFKNIDDFNNRVASNSTQANSSKICTAGDFQDGGTLCTK